MCLLFAFLFFKKNNVCLYWIELFCYFPLGYFRTKDGLENKQMHTYILGMTSQADHFNKTCFQQSVILLFCTPPLKFCSQWDSNLVLRNSFSAIRVRANAWIFTFSGCYFSDENIWILKERKSNSPFRPTFCPHKPQEGPKRKSILSCGFHQLLIRIFLTLKIK